MKILQQHVDFIEFEPIKKEVRIAEKVERKKFRFENVLVLFTCVEKNDDKKIAKRVMSEVKNFLKKLNLNEILIYPYAHLSNELAPSFQALEILKEMEKSARKLRIKVHRAPFGWTKSFHLKLKGHPLAEQFRSYEVEFETIEEKARRIESEFIVLEPDGKEHKIDFKKIERYRFLKKYPLLKSFIISEEIKGQPSEKPPSIEIMRKLELVDYEPASEPGMFRYYPNGVLIKNLIEKWIHKVVIEGLNAMEIDTPLLYNFEEPDIREQAISFRERDYRISLPRKTLILRFAGDFGLFRIMKDCTFTYKQLPLRIYEISPSFRRERRGELTGLRRCSFFYMPDLHSFCKDLEQAKTEFEILFKKYTELLRKLGIDHSICFRIVKKYYDELKPLILKIIKHAKKPALIELLSARKHYWICKSEHQAIDSVRGNAQLSTVQLDVEDSKRYGINYVDKDGKKKGCIIVHSSIGSIERLIYALLETALKKPNPILPIWLSPIQVRIIPLSEKYNKFAEKVMKEIEKEGIRVDLDDRELTVPRKIRDAEIRWIPYIVVVGEKEMKGKKLSVRFRKEGKVKEMKIKDLVDLIKKKVKDMPFEKLSIPKRLSKRPIFVPWGK